MSKTRQRYKSHDFEREFTAYKANRFVDYGRPRAPIFAKDVTYDRPEGVVLELRKLELARYRNGE